MMRRHFAAVNRIFLAHKFFYVDVSRTTHQRSAAATFDNVNRIPNGARVKDNFLAAVLFQKSLRQETDHVIAFDKAARLVE